MALFQILCRMLAAAVVVVLLTVPSVRAQGDLSIDQLDLIAPPDLSSPRATVASVRTSFEQAYELFRKAYRQYRTEPGLSASSEVAAQIRDATLLLHRAMAGLDLSAVPAVNRDETGTEVVLLLGEILSRLPPIDLESVPDAAAADAGDLAAWTIPHTDLTIVRLEDGPKAGQYVFSAATVEDARRLYDKVRLYGGRVQAGTDLYRFYTLTPGDLLPPKWYFLIERLPEWAQVRFFLDHAVWQWVGIVLTLVVLFGGWLLIVRAIGRHRPADGRPGTLRRLLPPLLLMAATALARSVIAHQVSASGIVLSVITVFSGALFYLAGAWAAYLACAAAGERIAVSSSLGRASIDASLIRVAGRVVGITMAIAVLFVGATSIGIPLYGVIAGLGVGGLALSLAARPTLENLIGGVTLYADRPVRVGEICRFGDAFGTVEEIGLRSTRIRALDHTLITVPNADFSNMVLTNYTRRDRSLFETVVALCYGTTTDQLHAILDQTKAMLEADPDVIADHLLVHLKEFGPYAFGIGIRAYVDTTHMIDFLPIQERLLFAILGIVRDAGADFAVQPAPPLASAADAEPTRA